jgi:hypothetical protein
MLSKAFAEALEDRMPVMQTYGLGCGKQWRSTREASLLNKLRLIVRQMPPFDADELLKCWANECADGLAGHGAQKHRVSPALCERVRWYDGVCKAVLRRSCALLTWLHAHEAEVQAAEEAHLVPLAERTEVAAEQRRCVAEAAGHLVMPNGDGLQCSTCGRTSGTRPLKWERLECVPPSPWPGVHVSHIPHLCIVGEATICSRCGKYATSGLRSFRKACTHPTASGKLVLRLAAAGREPYGVVRARRLRGDG